MKKVGKKIFNFIKKNKIIIAASISLLLFMSLIIIMSRKSHLIKKMLNSNYKGKENTELIGHPVKSPIVNSSKHNNVNYNILDNNKLKNGKNGGNGGNGGKCHQLQKSHANKCFSCEHELPFNEIYRSQKTKCFSCEQDLKNRIDSKSAFYGQPSKCFDCEAQLK